MGNNSLSMVDMKTVSTPTDGVFPKNVLILVEHPSGMPEINCSGVEGTAIREIGDYWEVVFNSKEDNALIYASFHKNSLEVINESDR